MKEEMKEIRAKYQDLLNPKFARLIGEFVDWKPYPDYEEEE